MGEGREGQGKRKGEEEKREQQLLQVAESTWVKGLSPLPGI